jgi:hypothetical protein
MSALPTMFAGPSLMTSVRLIRYKESEPTHSHRRQVMRRFAKTFAQPIAPDSVAPTSNKFTFDLAGLELGDDDLTEVRQEAVKAAMLAAARLKAGPAFSDFGTFSTFSTFSTFGSSVGRESLPEIQLPGEIDPIARRAIEQTLGGRSAGKIGGAVQKS